MASNKVMISNRQKEIKIPSGMRILIRRSCNAVLELENFALPAEVSVSFVNNAEIKDLNAKFRQNPNVTDVLSFPLGEDGKYETNQETGAAMLGDIVISMEKAVEQARLYGHSLKREIAFLTVHSLYHLLGYDHEVSGMEAVHMREKEENALEKLGLPRTHSYTNPDLNNR